MWVVTSDGERIVNLDQCTIIFINHEADMLFGKKLETWNVEANIMAASNSMMSNIILGEYCTECAAKNALNRIMSCFGSEGMNTCLRMPPSVGTSSLPNVDSNIIISGTTQDDIPAT